LGCILPIFLSIYNLVFEAMDVLGTALKEYYFDGKSAKLWVHDNHGPKEEMPINIYFRDLDAMPYLETLALQMCKGRTLDIGAGAGSHALALQKNKLEVKAIDISEGAVEVMIDRGVNAVCTDFFAFHNELFDTLLLLMNGIGLVQNIAGLKRFFAYAKTLLKDGGQLIFDSSDLSYLYDYEIPQLPHYYGEVKCCYEYRKEKTEWFSWLYVDATTLANIAFDCGWKTEILFTDSSDQYLARLTLR